MQVEFAVVIGVKRLATIFLHSLRHTSRDGPLYKKGQLHSFPLLSLHHFLHTLRRRLGWELRFG